MSLWIALWLAFFPTTTPLLPAGEGDPLLEPWWQTTGEIADSVLPLFDLPWQVEGEEVPVRPRLGWISPLWLRTGDTVAWRYQGLHLPDSLPQPVTHLFSRRGNLEYTHLGGVFARALGSLQILLGAGFREHRWLGYPLRRHAYGLEARWRRGHFLYRKFGTEGWESRHTLDLKKFTLRYPWATLAVAGFHLAAGSNLYHASIHTQTWRAQLEYFRGKGMGRLAYRIPPPVGFLRLWAGVATTGSEWYPDLILTLQGPGYRISTGYGLHSRVDTGEHYRTSPRAYLELWGQGAGLVGWGEVAYQRDLWVWQRGVVPKALTLAGRLQAHKDLGFLQTRLFAAAAAVATGQDTLFRASLGLWIGVPLRLYQGQVVLRPWTQGIVASVYPRWDAGLHWNLFRVVQGEFRIENLLDLRPADFSTLRRYTLLLAVVFPD